MNSSVSISFFCWFVDTFNYRFPIAEIANTHFWDIHAGLPLFLFVVDSLLSSVIRSRNSRQKEFVSFLLLLCSKVKENYKKK